MADNEPNAGEQPKQTMQLRIDTSNSVTQYTNIFKFSRLPEEVLLDIGMTAVDIGANTEGKAVPQMVMKYPTRLVMTYSTAKRMAISFAGLVKEYEDKFGPIPISSGGSNAKQAKPDEGSE
ncbi:MAG: DUF3467 domain-containing protein [Phycisphaerae bacterium]|jgi:hypothetical protein|nr:DUF3467 domain-containing protein [Phycisphaerae bacterium]HJN72060.1 DUF3467 domain-containing protein [Phycisphaerales bacterium]|tara:strand:+ start:48 stop:410 length:363 start_codon:yes stop_codon:yes gene_type:complete